MTKFLPESGPANQTSDISDLESPNWSRKGVPYAISTDPKYIINSVF